MPDILNAACVQVELSRFDLFHAHMFWQKQPPFRLGILFHAVRLLAFSASTTPLSFCYCSSQSAECPVVVNYVAEGLHCYYVLWCLADGVPCTWPRLALEPGILPGGQQNAVQCPLHGFAQLALVSGNGGQL